MAAALVSFFHVKTTSNFPGSVIIQIHLTERVVLYGKEPEETRRRPVLHYYSDIHTYDNLL